MYSAARKQDTVKICSINICGLSSRSKLMVDKYNDTQNFDFIAAQETGSDNAEKLKLLNMKVISDSNQSRNRGASLYFRNGSTCTKLAEISKLSKELDSTWGLAVIRNKRYIIGSVYVKLNYQAAIPETIQMLQAAQDLTKKYKACGVILCGDFNARHPLWGDDVTNNYGKQLFDLLNYNNFAIIASKTPTFLCEKGSSFIDLVIVSKNLENKVKSCITDDEVELYSGALKLQVIVIIQKLL